MNQSFIAFSITRVEMLRKRGWQFTLMNSNEEPVQEKGVVFITINGKRYRATRKEK